MDDDPGKFREALKAGYEAYNKLPTALGTFTMEFGGMEHKLNLLIHELLGLETDTGHALTSAILNFSTRMDILRSLVRDLPHAEPHREELFAVLDDAQKLNSYRNELIHNEWSGSIYLESSKTHMFQKNAMKPAGKGRQWKTTHITIAEIENQTAKCADVAFRAGVALTNLGTTRLGKQQPDQSV